MARECFARRSRQFSAICTRRAIILALHGPSVLFYFFLLFYPMFRTSSKPICNYDRVPFYCRLPLFMIIITKRFISLSCVPVSKISISLSPSLQIIHVSRRVSRLPLRRPSLPPPPPPPPPTPRMITRANYEARKFPSIRIRRDIIRTT